MPEVWWRPWPTKLLWVVVFVFHMAYMAQVNSIKPYTARGATLWRVF